MKIAVIGSRDFSDPEQVYEYVRGLYRTDMVVTGGARGVDRYAEMAAVSRRISRLVYEPKCEDDSDTYVSELHARNELIVKVADRVVAFYDGTSRGTASVIELARKLRKPLDVYGPRGKRT